MANKVIYIITNHFIKKKKKALIKQTLNLPRDKLMNTAKQI